MSGEARVWISYAAANKGAERYPSVPQTACGGLSRIATGDAGPTLVGNLEMIRLSSHSRKQWGQLGAILGGGIPVMHASAVRLLPPGHLGE